MLSTQNFCYNCFNERQDPSGACPYCGYDDMENREKYPIALKSGSVLNGQYIVGRVLGQGGFGITYLALDYQLSIKVAIKEYIPDGMATRLPETTLVSVYAGEKQDNFHYGSERFLDEARVLARFIGNKNIAAVKSYFNENNTAYFVMDYIEGISFKNYIKNKGGKVDYTDALRVLLPVMDALAAVHKEGLIHRDVTPDNIYITKDNEIKLLDFGSARYSLGDKSKSLDVILKAGYAPKEQYIRRGKQGPYTDIYSLAACFYASITGYLPPEALERMEEDEIVPISTRGIKIPDSLENAIMKGLEVRAEDRWQSIEEFRAAIEGAEASSASLAATGTPSIAINTPPATTSTGTETNAGTGGHSSVWQTTGQQFSGQYEQPPQYTAEQTATAEHRNIQSDLQQPPKEPVPNPIENKAITFLKKNKAAAIISAVACLILIISIIGAIGNNGDNGGSVAPAGNLEGVSDENGYVSDLQSDGTLELPITIEPIEIMMSDSWDEWSVHTEWVTESAFTEISNTLSIPLEVNIISNEEVLSKTELDVASGERSMFFSSYTDDEIDNLKALGATVIQPDNYEEYFIIMPWIEDDAAALIISEFEKITASIHVKDKEYDESAYRPGGIYSGDILNGNRDGYGLMLYSDGSWYYGDWKDDVCNGYGWSMSPSGSLYEGEFVNDLPTGNGTLTSAEGDQYFEEIFFNSETAQTARGNTVGNIVNEGLAAELDGWVYYRNDSDGGKLYKVRTDGTDKTKISDDSCGYINVADGWVYYSSRNDDDKLYRVRIDGKDKTRLSDDSSLDINIVDGWVYYRNWNAGINKYYKLRTDGKDITRLSDDFGYNINVVDGWVYYTDWSDGGYRLYKMRTDGTEGAKLGNDECGYINVVDGWVYYTNGSDDDKLYKISTDGKDETKLSDDSCSCINVVDGWVYYSNDSDGHQLYKMRTDGKDKTKLSSDLGYDINVAGGWVYYINADDTVLYRVRADGTGGRQIVD